MDKITDKRKPYKSFLQWTLSRNVRPYSRPFLGLTNGMTAVHELKARCTQGFRIDKRFYRKNPRTQFVWALHIKRPHKWCFTKVRLLKAPTDLALTLSEAPFTLVLAKQL